MTFFLRLLPLFIGVYSLPVFADTFVAKQSCPLYQSKNKLTNPNEVMTVPGQAYPVLELLGNPKRPDWVRVTTAALVSPERWVAAKCGDLERHLVEEVPSRCDIAGEQDSHVLALSWQGAFCELFGKGKPECTALDKTPASTRWLSLTLHGLWPNKSACGTDYGFCGEVKRKAKGFCSYPDIALSKNAQSKLAEVMPSADFGSCLEKHQWWKHGSCQQMNADKYFIEAARLTSLINESRMVKLLADSSGKMQSTATLRQAFTDEFGHQSAKRISFHCSRGLLTEIRLSLPATLDASLGLNHLLARQAPELRDNCPASFLVDTPG
ncbi:ribonuclease T2 family protein [Shewanella litorisediminis]|uniref:Ribonuclease T n=1 Tax=Shewanella litorisediminis TaxID=1173586 RepID=A0ABX7G3F7_9GAMM|nr:ribonuclease T [Shewanella litorisediminis]MCL2917214.1 ribonuclease T [Shewanella litorisediminis]QRH01688.1 ribonuclease T [Shewanella litorisediminis]